MEYAYDKGRLAAISAFEQSSKGAATIDQLSALIDAIIGQFGFRWFALLHNVDLVRRSKKALMLTTYPARWLDEIIEDIDSISTIPSRRHVRRRLQG